MLAVNERKDVLYTVLKDAIGVLTRNPTPTTLNPQP